MADINPSESRARLAELEAEAWRVAQLAATMAAAEVASGGPGMFFEPEEYPRVVKAARRLLNEARKQVEEKPVPRAP